MITKMNYNIFMMLAAMPALAACSDYAYDPGEPGAASDPLASAVNKEVVINPAQTFQTMQGIGASDCWMGNWVGRDWTSTREDVARVLFSQEIVDGQPQGAGLSMWRVNTGAGSAEIGDKSGITTAHRRAESFMNPDGTYDWSRCAGQQYFMEQARKMGTERFVLFSNSPLVQYTYNGQGRSDRGNSSNLMPNCYGKYADYLADVARHFTDAGYDISHISPVNEPNNQWNGRDQEGSGWTVAEAARLTRELDRALTERSLGTDILLGEGDSWDCLYGDKWISGGAVSHFWTPGDEAYIGDLAHVKPLYCCHSYWTDTAWDTQRDVRATVRAAADQYGLEVWQSEWCMLGDDIPKDEFPGHAAASDMDRALHMSKVMHNDFTVANVSSWCYWVAMDTPFGTNGNRWLLVYLNPAGETVFDGEGTAEASANLWALGNYSLFVRPGFKRVALDTRENKNFFGSAYVSPDSKRVVAVYTNMGAKPVRLSTTLPGADNATVRTFTTSASKHLAGVTLEKGADVVLDPESITTVVYDL